MLSLAAGWLALCFDIFYLPSLYGRQDGRQVRQPRLCRPPRLTTGHDTGQFLCKIAPVEDEKSAQSFKLFNSDHATTLPGSAWL